MTEQNTYFMGSDRIRENLVRFIGQLPFEQKGKRIVWKVTVERSAKRRSSGQNNLLHKWFDVIAKHTGYSPEEVKDLLVKQYVPTRVVTIHGLETECRAETSKLSVVEMQGLMTQVEAWAAGFGLMLPTAECWEPEKAAAPSEPMKVAA